MSALESTALRAGKIRVIMLLDMDSFYAQVDSLRLGLPATEPLAVRQWDSLIAVNYAARAAGVKRFMTPAQAQQACPDIHLPHVQTIDAEGNLLDAAAPSRLTQKAFLQRYRSASAKIFRLLLRCCGEKYVEKASVDEAYCDLSELVDTVILRARVQKTLLPIPEYEEALKLRGELKRANAFSCDETERLVLEAAAELSSSWHVVNKKGGDDLQATPGAEAATIGAATGEAASSAGEERKAWLDLELTMPVELRLLVGALIAQSVRNKVLQELGFTCSAGVSHNKMLAKLVAGRHKPNQQTLLSLTATQPLMQATPLKKIRFLGSKLGEELVRLCMQERNKHESPARSCAPAPEPREAAGERALKEEEREAAEEAENPDDESRDNEAEEAVQEEEEERDEEDEEEAEEERSVTAGAAQGLSLQLLRSHFGESNGTFLFRIVRGIDETAVKPKSRPKSFCCAKNVDAASCRSFAQAESWLKMNCVELACRLSSDHAEYARVPKTMTLHFTQGGGKKGSRSAPFPSSHTRDSILAAAMLLLKRAAREELGVPAIGRADDQLLFPCSYLAVAASHFEATHTGQSLQAMFAAQVRSNEESRVEEVPGTTTVVSKRRADASSAPTAKRTLADFFKKKPEQQPEVIELSDSD
jgi:nucleotidyltransferase/DNA polymerase involved in DNA repair